RSKRDWSSDVCSSDLGEDHRPLGQQLHEGDEKHHPGGQPQTTGQGPGPGSPSEHAQGRADAGVTAGYEGEEESEEHAPTLIARRGHGARRSSPSYTVPMPERAPSLDLTDLRERDLTTSELTAALPPAELDVEAAAQTVRPLVEDVAVRGAAAVLDASERFAGVRPEHLRVP